MAMSRKHYRAFAEEIKWQVDRVSQMRKSRSKEAATLTITILADGIARTCKRDNPNFRFDTFFEACGLDANGNMRS